MLERTKTNTRIPPDPHDDLIIQVEVAQGAISALVLLREEFRLVSRDDQSLAYGCLIHTAEMALNRALDLALRLIENAPAEQEDTPMTTSALARPTRPEGPTRKEDAHAGHGHL